MDRETGEASPFNTDGRWQTVTIPLTSFGYYNDDDGTTPFKKVVDDRNAGSYRNFGFLFCNADVVFDEKHEYPAQTFNQKIYFDNFRIVPNASKVVSDFPEE
jgi:hypothetical protein